MLLTLLGFERLSRLERKILHTACAALPASIADIAMIQLHSIKVVRHKPRKAGVYVYLEDCAPRFEHEIPQELRVEDGFVAAEIRSGLPARKLYIVSRLWVVRGRIFELAHEARSRPSLKAIRCRDVDALDMEVRTIFE